MIIKLSLVLFVQNNIDLKSIDKLSDNYIENNKIVNKNKYMIKRTKINLYNNNYSLNGLVTQFQ